MLNKGDKELDSIPILSCFVRELSDTIVFFHREEVIEIEKSSTSLAYVLENCNGLNRVRDIIDKAPHPKKDIVLFLSFLEGSGIISLKQNFYQKYLDISSPLEYFQSTSRSSESQKILKDNKNEISSKDMVQHESVFKKILSLRQSNRELLLCKDLFSELDFLRTISSSKAIRSVPSAGGFYEIDLYLYLPMGSKRLKAGVYKFSQNENKLNYVRGISCEETAFVFGTVQVLKCTGVLLIGGNMANTLYKYSNKALRLSLLEAGHIAQNAYMYAAVKNFGIFEYAGFNDNVVIDNVRQKNFIPLISLVFGGKAKKSQLKSAIERIEKTLDVKIVSTLQVETLVYKDNIVGYYSVTAYNKKVHCVSGASAQTVEIAKVKAISEAYERYFTNYGNICKSLEKYTEKSTKKEVILKVEDFIFFKTLKPIPILKKYKYIRGELLGTNKKVCAPPELIYYNSKSKKFPYIGITTNGCASNLDLDASIKSGVLELLERDALMKMWHNQETPKKLPNSIVGIAKKKVDFWKKLGVTMDVMDISTEFVPVILVAMFQKAKKINFLTFGCSAGVNYVEALNKALEEVEPRYVHISCTVEDDLNSTIQSESLVVGVEDHMKLYFCKNNFKKLNWLFDNKRKKAKNSELVFDIKNLSGLDIHTFIVKKPSKSNPFWITKSISKNLVPIYFGKNYIPIEHPMLDYGKKNFNKNIHFFS